MTEQNSSTAIQKVEQAMENQVNDTEQTKSQNPLDDFLQHQKRALEETGKAIESLFPEGFREHGKEAGKEFAKGMKILVDAVIGEVEKAAREIDKQMKQRQQSDAEAGDDKPSSTGATKVKVQVE